MSAVEKRLARLKAIRTELRNLDLDVAADAVGDEIADIEGLSTSPAAEYLEAVMELDEGLRKGMNELKRPRRQTMTNEQKIDAIAVAHQRLLDERPGWATLAEVAKIPEAERMLEKIDRALGRLRAEDARLKAEQDGSRDPAARRREHQLDAVAYTRRIEAEFRQELAWRGHPQQTSPPTQREIVERALGRILETHGEHAAAHCRRLLAPASAMAG